MSCKSAIYMANTSSQTLSVGDVIDLGSVVRKLGNNLSSVGNAVVTSGLGYYDISVSITASPATTGTVTVIAYKDGTAIPGATASAYGTGDYPVNIVVDAIVREQCPCDAQSSISLVLYGAASTVTNVATKVVKV